MSSSSVQHYDVPKTNDNSMWCSMVEASSASADTEANHVGTRAARYFRKGNQVRRRLSI
ncbi:hypothetical protein HETIRDRAFT_142872 [Heterobasidion irregulare TC 32-1]|uniref:Uncharacterized protein n=1 Tax=Heterobasidion irregulare (strain TC 32-1) TaxID=747525 RepID=W4K0J1_HETIT|nr:uncharacterized protein HETIRDRAFT_142872 [Heterobasidion irregulare TC 32-1]ETW78835.1 hypothetical protein HETIRDRAFT_142872 [Heterobasidion irregulare TC 32-1]